MTRGRNVCRHDNARLMIFRPHETLQKPTFPSPPKNGHQIYFFVRPSTLIPEVRQLKMTILNFLLHATNYRNPFLRTLVPSIGAAFALQGAVAVPSILAQSERFYDLSGSLTYLSVTALSLYLPTLRARAAAAAIGAAKPAWPSLLAAFTGAGGANGFNWRQVILSTAVSIWATRRKSVFHPRQRRVHG